MDETNSAPNPFHRACYLSGPTAAGKTAVGVALARRLGAEVVALDSMTLYRGMDIGTAKPSAAEQGGVPHHLIDVLDPWETASVAQYRAWALEVLAGIAARGHRALFVGGTALYLKALLRGLFVGPGADAALRARLDDEADALGSAALHARLAQLDPATARRLHPNDRRRVVRALEVHALTGQPLSRLQAEHDRPAPPHVAVVALDRPRVALGRRIDERVRRMIAGGLLDEVRRLQAGPRPLGATAAQGVGYREAHDRLAGRIDSDAAMTALIQTRTRQFAKRQMTWFRGLGEVRLWPVGEDEPAETTADRLAAVYQAPGERRASGG
jgi:tRNA dimethylallyltransferase